MSVNTLELEFGRFTFLDRHCVIATAKHGVNIDGAKVAQAVAMIEQHLPGDYALILDRKEDYSIMPVEVYQFFSRIERLKAVVIVSYNEKKQLPKDMEQKIFGKKIECFSDIESAHHWLKEVVFSAN